MTPGSDHTTPLPWKISFRSPAPAAFDAALRSLVDDRVASRLFDQDPTLWGPEAEAEAAKRLAWVHLAESSRPLVEQITRLRTEFLAAGLDRVVLCGMGGSSLAPEVICGAAGVELVVLDSSHPDFVRTVVDEEIARTVVVVSSKSGGTVETDSQRRAYELAFTEAGISPAERIVVVTDPGSPLHHEASAAGCRVFEADPDVGGRYSALTAFGLVPCGLAGVDLAQLLDEAAQIQPALAADDLSNPGLELGAFLGAAAEHQVDKLILGDARPGDSGFGAWVEQLVAESTGKNGTGVLPINVGTTRSPNFDPSTPDSVLVSYGPDTGLSNDAQRWSAHVEAPMGAQMLLWEVATAVCGRLLGINPFDQPDVESAKAAARGMLEGTDDSPAPVFSEGGIAVFASGDWLPESVSSVAEAVSALLSHIDPDQGYLAIQAYLDRHRDSDLESVRDQLAIRTSRPVSFGWGPRFLHSTGQYHKGGPATGVFLQITGQPAADLSVPERPFTFGEFIAAQAHGDGQVLGQRRRPVLRLHLSQPDLLSTLTEALT
ncbi:glucose-6-phosphate isomerase [Nocardioides gilvus]|uniref:glucose-6-phosphate isomerase n=1 Tax=Nocardioides gilvus TaxID=1735589 RepID=UPI00194F3CC4|nr:glucose-6-phosphate isomerase [Nocardioides gilvus]